VRYVRDTTHRLRLRPHFEPKELDDECEQIIATFMQDLHGSLTFPLNTDDLTKLIERDAANLDLYADLTHEGADVEGVTYFQPNQKPIVRISNRLSEENQSENRLRTTLTHEYGHVKFHAPLWQVEDTSSLALFSDVPPATIQKCRRSTIAHASTTDWMEWQAGYVCGAVLMPVSSVRKLVQSYFERYNLYAPLNQAMPAVRNLINQIAVHFAVSQDAARVRLIKLGYLTDQDVGPTLFG